MTRNHLSESKPKPLAPAVTVIVPVYDAEPYLEECLRSIADQTFRNFEVIMINDGSTDGSRQICERFCSSDPRFKLLNLPNRGVSAARNAGIDRARGLYICFVDADDTIHPSLFELLTDTACNTDCDVVISSHTFGSKPNFSYKNLKPEIFSPEEITELGLYKRRKVTAIWASLIHRNIFSGGLRFKENIRFEDLDIFYKILLSSKKVALLPDKLYFYRTNTSSFLNTFSEGRFDALNVTDEMLAYMSDKSPTLLKAARDRRFGAHYNALLLLLKYNLDRPEIQQRCIGVIKTERLSEIFNRKVKLKNRLGAIASFGGIFFIKFLRTLIK